LARGSEKAGKSRDSQAISATSALCTLEQYIGGFPVEQEELRGKTLKNRG
jgi:hypothetical protein